MGLGTHRGRGSISWENLAQQLPHPTCRAPHREGWRSPTALPPDAGCKDVEAQRRHYVTATPLATHALAGMECRRQPNISPTHLKAVAYHRTPGRRYQRG